MSLVGVHPLWDHLARNRKHGKLGVAKLVLTLVGTNIIGEIIVT